MLHSCCKQPLSIEAIVAIVPDTLIQSISVQSSPASPVIVAKKKTEAELHILNVFSLFSG